MANTLVLPVPDRLVASYVVGGPDHIPAGLQDRDAEGLPVRPHADIEPRVDVIGPADPPLDDLLDLLDCPDCGPHADPEDLVRIRRADRHLLVTATYTPAWPPLHIWTAGTTAGALASATGGVLLDPAAPLLPDPRWTPCALRERDNFMAAEWIDVSVSLDETDIRRGLRMTTSGLARFGLPELQVGWLAPDIARQWGTVIRGTAQTLLQAHWSDLDAHPSAFREIPDTITVTTDDLSQATGGQLPPASTEVRVRLDPGSPGNPSFLTLSPPRTFRGRAVQWRREVIATLLA